MISVFYLGLALVLVGQLWFAKHAFGYSTGWGVAVLLIPFAGLVFAFKEWELTRGAVAVNVLGILLVVGATISLSLNKSTVAQEVAANDASLDPDQMHARASLLRSCRDTTLTAGVCECVVARLAQHYVGPDLPALVKEHEATDRWRPGYEDFLKASLTLCSSATPPTGGGPGSSAVVPPVVQTPAEAGPTNNPYDWTSSSFDGKAVLKQTLAVAHSCNLSCTVAGQQAWKATADCLGTGRDFRFVSVDCERVVVVHNVRVDGSDWKAISAATVFKRHKKAYDVGAVTVVKDINRVKAAPTWLQGVLGGSGEPPHYSKDGASVEVDAVDGKHSQIPLVVADEEPAPAEEEKAPPPAPKKKKKKH